MQWLVLALALGFLISRLKSIRLGFWYITIDFWKPPAKKSIPEQDEEHHQLRD
jgi:hypothetical protein